MSNELQLKPPDVIDVNNNNNDDNDDNATMLYFPWLSWLLILIDFQSTSLYPPMCEYNWELIWVTVNVRSD